jgi:hypothetical protein
VTEQEALNLIREMGEFEIAWAMVCDTCGVHWNPSVMPGAKTCAEMDSESSPLFGETPSGCKGMLRTEAVAFIAKGADLSLITWSDLD